MRSRGTAVFGAPRFWTSAFLGSLPLIGGIAGLVAGGTWIYAVADGYVTGKRKGR